MMLSFVSQSLLVADATAWKAMGERFAGRGAEFSQSEAVSLLVMAVAAVATIWLLQRLAQRQENPPTYNRPRRLFGQLCRAHRLSRKDRQLLRRLAEQLRLRQPALLFVKPDYFSLESLPAALSHEHREIDMLRRRLFAVES